VTDRRNLAAIDSPEAQDTLLLKIGAAADASVDWIQIREKDLSGKDCSSLAREALQRVARSSARKAAPTRILVNDRLDIALSQRAGGVHLGENSLPLAEVKRLVENRGERKDFLIGVSCHSSETSRAAASGGAHYLFFGPVFATPSKAAFGAPQGLEQLAEVCRGGLHTGSRDRRNYFGERRRLPRCGRIRARGHSSFPGCAGHVLCGAVPAEADTLISIAISQKDGRLAAWCQRAAFLVLRPLAAGGSVRLFSVLLYL